MNKANLQESRRQVEAAMYEAGNYVSNSGHRHLGQNVNSFEHVAHQARVDRLLRRIFASRPA